MDSLYTWVLSFAFLVALICIIAYQLLCLLDLEFDYTNPYDSASRINATVMPELITQGFLGFLFLITRHWFMLLMSLPYLCYNVRLYMRRQNLVDVTEIFNQLSREKHLRLYKLTYILLLFFSSVFWMIYSIMEDNN